MNENEAYEKLQEWLALAEELRCHGNYSIKELFDELSDRIGEPQ